MSNCPWCDEDLGCRSGDEATCDFKNLAKEPVAIKNRMDAEHKAVLDIISKEYSDPEELNKAKADMNDKLQGIRIMKQVYEEEFNMVYVPSTQLEFTHKLIRFLANVKKLERKKK
jgi:hypothetical protein